LKRSASRPSEAPPLWMWSASGLLVLLVFAITFGDYLDDAVTRREAENHAHRTRIAELGRQRDDRSRALHVIAIGNSSLRNATFFDEDMERFSRENGGPEIRFLRITEADGQLHDFLPLFAAIFASPPDLLILQSWLLPDRSSARQRRLHSAYRAGDIPSDAIPRSRHRERLLAGRETLQHQSWIVERVVSKLGARLGVGSGNRFVEHQRQIYCNPGHRERVLARRRLDYPPEHESNVDPTAAATVERLIEQAAAAGTTLVFMDIPVAAPIAALPGVQRRWELQRSFFEMHSDSPSLEHWQLDRSIPDSEFCDWVHLSRSGRRIYAGWLVERLRRFDDARGSR